MPRFQQCCVAIWYRLFGLPMHAQVVGGYHCMLTCRGDTEKYWWYLFPSWSNSFKYSHKYQRTAFEICGYRPKNPDSHSILWMRLPVLSGVFLVFCGTHHGLSSHLLANSKLNLLAFGASLLPITLSLKSLLSWCLCHVTKTWYIYIYIYLYLAMRLRQETEHRSVLSRWIPWNSI